MRRAAPLAFLLILAAGLVVLRRPSPPPAHSGHQPKDFARVEPTPVTPWRAPEVDLAALFPRATNHVIETRILSGLLVPIQKTLGRPLHPDENPLRIYRVADHGRSVGAVMITRVKGEHGGIEIVTGVETNGTVRGVRIQSHREPPTVAAFIGDGAWLAAFAGKTSRSSLRPGEDLPEAPAAARKSAEAIAAGVRDQLILYSFAQQAPEARELQPHLHH